MIKAYVYKQSQYPVSSVKIKKLLSDFFKKEGIVSDSFVSVAIVDEKKMLSIARKYYPKDNNIHSVFSFVEDEVTGFSEKKGKGINLGEIIICFPKVLDEAKKENKLIERKVFELLKHGGEHLLGRHHPE